MGPSLDLSYTTPQTQTPFVILPDLYTDDYDAFESTVSNSSLTHTTPSQTTYFHDMSPMAQTQGGSAGSLPRLGSSLYRASKTASSTSQEGAVHKLATQTRLVFTLPWGCVCCLGGPAAAEEYKNAELLSLQCLDSLLPSTLPGTSKLANTDAHSLLHSDEAI